MTKIEIMKYSMVGLIALLGSVPLAASADQAFQNQVYSAPKSKQTFIVSAILSRNGQPGTIRLVNAVNQGYSKDEVLGKAVKAIQDEYPNYSVTTTLVTEMPAQSDCQVRI